MTWIATTVIKRGHAGERQPSKEFATVEQMGGTCVFLCSDAAAQITGTTISVDGGWTAL